MDTVLDDLSDPPVFAELAVTAAQPLADNVVGFELRHPGGDDLAPFTAGSHVQVVTPSGAVRRYSLCNDPHETARYEIAVKRDAFGRGGSISMADDLKAGDLLPVAQPRNEFALGPRARAFLFIAGGIGITPILSMMRFLDATGQRNFKLVYLTRDPQSTAFGDVIAAQFAELTRIHHDHGNLADAFDLWPLLAKPTQAHIHCCGPRALMDSVRDMSGHWPFGSVHFESFGVDAATRRHDLPFDVHLARSGRTIHVPATLSILEALRAEGIAVRSSCEAGSCGSCRTGLVAGDVDHRDFVLGEHERDGTIMVCCSRARAGSLTLDL